tara:strand:+ start:60 stop:572 length:513 start_codon:yes stop_codon:yes gene_type:complete
MKKIEIKGKRNIDKINKEENPIRKESSKWKLDDEYFTYSKQLEIVNLLYLEDASLEKSEFFKKEIEKKRKGYYRQDIEKKINDDRYFVTLDHIIELLVSSKLLCYYCKQECCLVYKEVLNKKQWTLDRLDNNLGHNNENVVLACLECNIKRGEIDSNRFKMGKQLKINKL